jgi:hypothetical protein
VGKLIRSRGTAEGHNIFLRKITNGAPSQAAVGKNTLASYPKLVAEFLGLENSEQYTVHCLRRTGATILADRGVSKITLKRAGRWTSDSVCDGYIAESSISKLTIANALVNQANNNTVSKSDNDKCVKNIYISNTTGNVVINLYSLFIVFPILNFDLLI